MERAERRANTLRVLLLAIIVISLAISGLRAMANSDGFGGFNGMPESLIFFGGLAAIYFVPTFIGRGKRNIAAIAALNLVAGWTLVGWIIALVWAMTKDPEYVSTRR